MSCTDVSLGNIKKKGGGWTLYRINIFRLDPTRQVSNVHFRQKRYFGGWLIIIILIKFSCKLPENGRQKGWAWAQEAQVRADEERKRGEESTEKI